MSQKTSKTAGWILIFGWACLPAYGDSTLAPTLLSPSALVGAPPNLVKKLEAMGCQVPQAYYPAQPNNFVKGSFFRKGQTDWAVLCSKDGVSTIHFFPGGETPCPLELEPREDAGFFQNTGKAMEYSRILGTAGKKELLKSYADYKDSGAPKPPPIDHDALSDGFQEKSSTNFYCRNGKWEPLQGAD